MHPILGSLTEKVLLATTGGGVAFNRLPLSADEVIELGQLDDECFVVILEEGFCIETGGEYRL